MKCREKCDGKEKPMPERQWTVMELDIFLDWWFIDLREAGVGYLPESPEPAFDMTRWP